MEAYAEKHGFEIVGTTVEQAGGVDLSRRGLAEVSSAVATGEVDLLLVTNPSRLSRNAVSMDAYLRWLEDQFVEVVCADSAIPQTSTEILMALMKESGISLDRARY